MSARHLGVYLAADQNAASAAGCQAASAVKVLFLLGRPSFDIARNTHGEAL